MRWFLPTSVYRGNRFQYERKLLSSLNLFVVSLLKLGYIDVQRSQKGYENLNIEVFLTSPLIYRGKNYIKVIK